MSKIRILVLTTVLLLIVNSIWAEQATLQWRADVNSVEYVFEAATDSQFTHLVDAINTTETQVTVDLEEGYVYFFRVAGINADGVQGAYSELRSINLIPDVIVVAQSASDYSYRPNILVANYWYYLGLNYYHHGDTQTAESYFREALQVDPEFTVPAMDANRSVTTVTLGGNEYVICDVEAYALHPIFGSTFKLYIRKAHEYEVLGNIDAAISYLEIVKRADPFNEEVNRKLAELYEIRGRSIYPVG